MISKLYNWWAICKICLIINKITKLCEVSLSVQINSESY
jgi:hypothetical protein